MPDCKLVVSSGLGEAIDSKLAAAVVGNLRYSRDVVATPATEVSAAGSRSSEIGLVGQLVITFLSSGAAVALINALKPIFERAPSSTIEVGTLKITSSMISRADLEALIRKEVER